MRDLPLNPAPATVSVYAVDYGNTLSPSLGGPEQRINRPGNRWRAAFSMPPMMNKDAGRVFVARLVQGQSQGVRTRLPLGGFDPGEPGAPVVSNSGQVGSRLNLSGFASGYTIKEGQFFSIFTGGAHYLYQAAEEVSATAAGVVSLGFAPMLRTSPQAGDVCHFKQPMIEGLIEGSEVKWDLGVDYYIGLEFTIKERK